LKLLANRVSNKLEEGDFKGAARIASSDESFAAVNEATLKKLREKHPPAYTDSVYPQFQVPQATVEITPSVIKRAIYSFPTGSAAGPDGLRPQHLKDLISSPVREAGNCLLEALTGVVNLVLSGQTPCEAQPFFFGANLIGFNKNDGGVRPIAIGNTLRRLVAKCAGSTIKADMAALLSPFQLGYGTPRGAEIAVHSARRYLNNLESNHLMFKLDFKNAFNSIRRDKMLDRVLQVVPEIFPLIFSAYRHPTFLFFGECTIDSAEGVQQGDPLGPLLFCLTIHQIVESLKSEFKVFYLDDGTLGGSPGDVRDDLLQLQCAAEEINLSLNLSKCEVICKEGIIQSSILSSFPTVKCVNPSEATLLGSPIGSSAACVDAAIQAKIDDLKVMGRRLELLHTHDALCLLRHVFSMPKVLYLLRTAPCFSSPLLSTFDGLQRTLLETICNVHLNDEAWLQASFPVASGGLGIRSVVTLAPSAFLASVTGSSSTCNLILPDKFLSIDYSQATLALDVWGESHSDASPTGSAATTQKAWDQPVIDAQFSTLFQGSSPKCKARLLASQKKESGAWLNAPPITALGLRMEDIVISTAVGLRLGLSLCSRHVCHQCGKEVDESGTHGLSCRRSQGRHPRHSQLNEVVKRSLAAANVPAVLEPRGLCTANDSRPDGLTLIPWSRGRSLVWDVTVHDSFAPSNIGLSSHGAGRLADQAAIYIYSAVQYTE
jgi:hypothetical protein